MLNVKELKTLIKAHNKLSQIKIPPRATQEQLINLIESAGYKVDHEKKVIKPTVKRGKQITLKQAEELSKPKVKTELQKQKLQEKKELKMEEEKKKIRMAKKEAVEQFKKSQKPAPKPAPKPDLKLKPVEELKPKFKKEDEVRPKEKVGRPRVDPKKIKVLERNPKKKEEPKKDINAPIEMKDFKKDILKFKKVVITNAIKEVKQLKTKKEIEKYYRDLSKIINDRYINVIDNEEYDDEVQDMKDKFFDYTEKLINKLPIVSVKDLETGKNKTITSIKDMKAFIDKMNKYKKELQKTNPNSTKTQKVEDYVDITLQKKLVELMKKLPDEKEEDKPLSAKAQEKINKLKQELE